MTSIELIVGLGLFVVSLIFAAYLLWSEMSTRAALRKAFERVHASTRRSEELLNEMTPKPVGTTRVLTADLKKELYEKQTEILKLNELERASLSPDSTCDPRDASIGELLLVNLWVEQAEERSLVENIAVANAFLALKRGRNNRITAKDQSAH